MSEVRPVIQCREATLAYGHTAVLTHLNLSIPRHSLNLLVGPNGAGKTTFVRACLGLIPCAAGEITRDFGTHPAAYVPQQKKLDPAYPLTVADIVSMGLYPTLGWRRPNAACRRRVAETLEAFGLTAHAGQRFDELSGGFRQRTLLARAAVSEAEVLFLDEPTAGLDRESEASLVRFIRDLHAQEGRTILWVLHDLHWRAGLAARTLTFDGKGGVSC